jgi:putative hydrolase of the HAD superfamily
VHVADKPPVEAVLFDLGNTLVTYWQRQEWLAILHEAIEGVIRFAERKGRLRVSEQAVWERVKEHDHELPGHHVYPLEERLAAILSPASLSEPLLAEASRHFMAPLFARGRVCADALPTLAALREAGLKTAIVSNSPWGSPATLWREEIERLGLRSRVDADVFCGDVGWRKPARPIFDAVLGKLGLAADRCLFVGDDPRWDLAGPRALGMRALLLDRAGDPAIAGESPIQSLEELEGRLSLLGGP